jgi:CheY-like chemotaxis protein
MRTILIVDDEFGVGEVIEAILEDEGYRVVSAINGRQGLGRLAESKPDLILLDFMMPIMNGAAMLRTMQANPAFRDIPVVMMSSLDERTVRTQCDGIAGFIRKPFRAALLVQTIARVLDSDRTDGAPA